MARFVRKSTKRPSSQPTQPQTDGNGSFEDTAVVSEAEEEEAADEAFAEEAQREAAEAADGAALDGERASAEALIEEDLRDANPHRATPEPETAEAQTTEAQTTEAQTTEAQAVPQIDDSAAGTIESGAPESAEAPAEVIESPAETSDRTADAEAAGDTGEADAVEAPQETGGTEPGSDREVVRSRSRRRRGNGRPGEERPGDERPRAGTGDRSGEASGQGDEDEASAAERDEKSRSQMLVHVDEDKIQIAILEGRTLVEHYTAHRRAQSIAGNIYLGKVQNVLPGMEAAFVDIGTPKNAVLYAGDVRYVSDEYPGTTPRIEDILTVGQSVLVQVVKDPMGAKGARLTTEISLPGRFVVLVPETDSTGISRRLPESERDRLRSILDRIRPAGFGIIVRTAAEETTERQLQVDLDRLEALWHDIYRTSTRANPPTIVYEEPELVIRTVREIFSADFRRLIVDDAEVHARISEYLGEYEPELLTKIVLYDDELSLFRRHHVTDQLKTGVSRKVWLPSGGSLVFDKGEALTVIDVNTSKNVGKSSLEETVYQNNLEAAEEIARQLRLRDIGGIIVIDFIDMEIKKNRDAVLKAFRQAVAKDKTKTQVYDISELGLVEMTRKNVSEGLIESFSRQCGACSGRGLLIDEELLG